MSWNDYLAYLTTRWMRRWAFMDGLGSEKSAEDGSQERKEPWSQWWFGLLPMAIKLFLYGRFRRLLRFLAD